MNYLLNRWVLLAFAVLFSLVALFWRDAVEQSTDSFAGFVSSGVDPIAITSDDLVKAKLTRFEKERNDKGQLRVSELRPEGMKDGQEVISVRLASRVANNDYPVLHVDMLANDGATVLRTVDFQAVEYEHGSAFADERVQVKVRPAPGEVRFRVRADYP